MLTKHLKMFMLNDTSIGYSSVSIIHYSITLIVSSIIDLCFKRYGAILQTPQTITIELIYRTCINNLIGKSCQFFTILPKITIQTTLYNFLRMGIDNFCVTPDRLAEVRKRVTEVDLEV